MLKQTKIDLTGAAHKMPAIMSRLIPKNVYSALHDAQDEPPKLMELKLASQIRIQLQAFNPATYKVEEPLQYIEVQCFFVCYSGCLCVAIGSGQAEEVRT